MLWHIFQRDEKGGGFTERVEMERKVILACYAIAIALGFLGLFCAAAGFAVEFTRIKASELQHISYRKCIYPKSPVSYFALAAAFFLVITQFIIMYVLFKAKSANGPHQSNTWIMRLTFVSWLIGVAGLENLNHYSRRFANFAAFIMIFVGAFASKSETPGPGNCNFLVFPIPGVYAAAAVLLLVSIVLETTCCLIACVANNINDVRGVSV